MPHSTQNISRLLLRQPCRLAANAARARASN